MEIRIAAEKDMAAIYALRVEVFVDEQGVPREIELDAEDSAATHYLAEADGVAVGCGRVLWNGKSAHIGRLAVKRSFRGRGIGAAVCRYILADCRKRGSESIWLNAQLHAVGFYKTLGFCPEGDIFLEAGIEHVKMVYGDGREKP